MIINEEIKINREKFYTWSQTNNDWMYANIFDTPEECIKDAETTMEQYLDAKEGYTIYVGECIEPTFCIELDEVLENIVEQAECDYGEVTEDWDIYYNENDKNREKIYNKYEKKLNDLINEYIKEIGENTRFLDVKNIKKIVIMEGDDQDGTND